MPLTMPSLFVFLEIKDYVPDAWAGKVCVRMRGEGCVCGCSGFVQTVIQKHFPAWSFAAAPLIPCQGGT